MNIKQRVVVLCIVELNANWAYVYQVLANSLHIYGLI